jgi:hypothetical protein
MTFYLLASNTASPDVSLGAFINNTPIVAMFLPVVNDWSRRAGIAASKRCRPSWRQRILA